MKKSLLLSRLSQTRFFLLLALPFLIYSCSKPQKSINANTNYDPISQDIIIKDSIYPGIKGLMVNSGNSLIKILEYFPTGKGPHPTLIMLHGYTGMGGNIDVATTVCRAGWNVIFFRYRGSWGMPGDFSFQHCVEDAVNIANYCKSHSDSMNVDTSRIALFGHSMGGWVALKAASQLPFVKNVFALSTWDIYKDVVSQKNKGTLDLSYKKAEGYSELKIPSGKALYNPVLADSMAFILSNDGKKIFGKNIFILDEHHDNKYIVDSLQKYAKSLTYEVWKTDHGFTNTKISMIRKLISFIAE